MNILNSRVNNNIFNNLIRAGNCTQELNMGVLNPFSSIMESLGLQIHVSASDNANVNSNASYVANVGGNYNNDAGNTGPFYVNVNNNASNTNDNIGARLVAAYPYSGQYSYRILRLFTGFIISIITSKISSKVIRYRSQCICYALAKVNGKILLTKGWVSSSLNKIVEDLLESNRGYFYNNPYLSSVYGKFTSERGGSITL